LWKVQQRVLRRVRAEEKESKNLFAVIRAEEKESPQTEPKAGTVFFETFLEASGLQVYLLGS